MTIRKKILSILLFSAGILLGTLFFGMIAWGDMETGLWDSMGSSEEPLRSLRCPAVINLSETRQVRAEIINNTDKEVHVLVRTHITGGSPALVRKSEDRLVLEPGATFDLSFPVTAADRAYGRVIMVRMHQYRSSPLPSRDASCGILVLDLAGLPGATAAVLILAVSLALTGAGILLWHAIHQPLKGPARSAASAMTAMGALMIVGMAVALLNLWLASFLLVILMVLLTVVVIAEFTQS